MEPDEANIYALPLRWFEKDSIFRSACEGGGMKYRRPPAGVEWGTRPFLFLIQFPAAREEQQVGGAKGRLGSTTDCFHFCDKFRRQVADERVCPRYVG